MKKSFMKKSLVLLLALTMMATTALTGCGKKDTGNNTGTETGTGTDTDTDAGTDTGAADDLTINVSVGPEPETLDPTMNTAADGSTYLNHVFEGLMKVDAEANIVQGAAESYEVSEDGLVYTFKIRSDAKWSDGTDLTAEAFVYSWQRLVDPTTASDYNYMIDMVKNANEIMAGTVDKSELGIKAIDSKTLEITLAVATPYFLEICAFPATFPLREDIVSANPDTWFQDPATYIGNGPYVVKTWEHQAQIVMEQNPNYYGLADLGPKTINFKLMEDDNTILAAYENGEILFGDSLPSEEIERMTGNGLYIEGQLGTYFLCLNVEDEALKDANVRKALALAIDRNYLVESVAKGGQQPADTFVPTGLSDVDNTAEFHEKAEKWFSVDPANYEANVAEAKQLLADAGYPNGEGFPSIELMINPGHESIAEAVIYMWQQELGITATLSSQDWSVFIETRNSGDYQIARHGWLADYNDPISFLDMWLTGGGNNDAQWSNADYDALIAKVKASSDRAERIDLMHQAEAILAKDMPIIPLYFYTDLFLKSDKLQGFYSSPLGYKFFMYTSVTE
ncbi:MAG: peptide transporter substrate-binding protein [Anaerocolumna sp.]|jgi:oligopeptide transport system substrate-binding protein|nr:peptide transporter substrate-binding protein [Anaerocolumna sp.]